MGRQYSQPTLYRDRQCPVCGFWFTARGLSGHMRFRHGAKSQPKPQLGLRESQTVVAAKRLLDLAKKQRGEMGQMSERLFRWFQEDLLVDHFESQFGDRAIPLERLHPEVATKFRLERLKKLEQQADQAEAEVEELRQQTP